MEEERMIEQLKVRRERITADSSSPNKEWRLTAFLRKSCLSLVLVLAFICVGTQTSEGAGEAQSEKKEVGKLINEETPFITEVMTKEELQTYLKEKGMKNAIERFQGPTLLWENTFDVAIDKAVEKQISDVTEKGNCVLYSYSQDSLIKVVLFVDPKGNVRKRMEFKDIRDTKTENRRVEHFLYIAMSGKYAGVYKFERDKKRATFTYYDEEGNLLWTKMVSRQALPDTHVTMISYDGEMIVTAEGNPHWSVEEEAVGVDLHVNKLRFHDSKGNLLCEYGGFRNISIGKLSDDGKYYAAIMWWSKGVNRSENRLIYIRTKDGKVLWQRPFPGYYNWEPGDEKDLAISEKGSYVAVVKFSEQGRRNAEVHVFDRIGKMIARVRTGSIRTVSEDGLLDVWDTIDLLRKERLDVKFDYDRFFYWDREAFQTFLLISGNVFWSIPGEGWFDYSRNGKFLKMRIRLHEGGTLRKLRMFKFEAQGVTK
jgi:hypothetical protein